MLTDTWGHAVSSSAQPAVAAFDRAVLAYAAHRADTLTHVDEALAWDPELTLGHVAHGFALRFLARRDALMAAAQACAQARRCAAARPGSRREQLLVAALSAFCAGDARRAMTTLAECSAAYPACLFSFKTHHALCFMYGALEAMQHSATRVLQERDPALPGHGFVLGCHAFALEESGAYHAAEQAADEALAREPQDAWAFHARLHVLSAEQRVHEALAAASTVAQRFAGCNNFQAHLTWHHALLALADGACEQALALYDAQLCPALGRDYRDFVNCASLLWRLERAGAAVGERWQRLAALAAAHTGDHQLAFADAHYVLALLRAGQHTNARRFLAAMRESVALRDDTDARVQRALGIPLSSALAARDGVGGVGGGSEPPRIPEELAGLGGSRAQRALFTLIADAPLAI